MTEPSAYLDYSPDSPHFPIPPNYIGYDEDYDTDNGNDNDNDNGNDNGGNDIKIKIRNIIIGQCQHIDLNNDSVEDIFKITIYLSCQKESPIQTKIYFEKSCNSVYDYELIAKHVYYNNYIKNNSKCISNSVAVFGDIYDILTQLIINTLNNICDKNSNNIHLNITKNEISHSINFPNFNNIVTFTYSKLNKNNTFTECPVCYNNYQDGSKILLNCNHCLCKVCFYNIIKNSSYRTENKCPVCRHHIEF